MMKLIAIAIVSLFLFAATSEAAMITLRPSQVPGHEGKCWFADAGWDLIPGESRTVRSQCMQITCNDDFSMAYYTCGVVSSDCELGSSDLTKDYPDCCPKFTC